MSAIEQRARELLVAAYRGADYSPMMHESHNLIHGRPSRRERAALDAIIAALTPPEGFVLVPVDSERDADRYRHLKRGYLQCWEDSCTEEPAQANFCFECKGWDIDSAIDADIALSKLEASP